ncbi:MAG: tRNA (adenosine(37)-N6)-threonylcarbamoyltransferase complex dimerization subunit type 1 TsaB [Anaerolineales bacterium]|nr:tRNA (adenosine(37)-N6)-threonylcarbamoyltransferase complex dimerization subunit type 1 TsaB [Anaerolineales bacterium]
MLLALDTATRAIGVALHSGDELLAEHTWVSRGYHTVQLSPEIALMLRRANCSPSDLTAVAVARGPGSFTGLRIGMALAKGMALAHHLRMIAVPTLDILAGSQPPREEPMFAVLQAGRGRIAAVWYNWSPTGWEAEDEAETMTWEDVIASLEEETYICGEIDRDGLTVLREEPLAIIASPALSLRRPGILAELAWSRMRNGDVDDPASIEPAYLHRKSGNGL